jgi:hypothetical protein
MPKRTDNLVCVFEKKKNRFNKFYYSSILTLEENINNCFYEIDYEVYLFSDNQYWSGFDDASTSGDLMYSKVGSHDELIKLGTWKKQKDNSLFIKASTKTLKYAYYGIPKGNMILLYDAAPTNSLEKLFIQNNL